MDCRWIFGIFVVIATVAISSADDSKDDKKVKKLQIGVKKRVSDCKIKSRKGDTLNMHYTVSTATISYW